MKVTFKACAPLLVVSLYLLKRSHGEDVGKNFPQDFAQSNDTLASSECGWTVNDIIRCSGEDVLIDTSFFVTATNGSYPLFIGDQFFQLDRTNGLLNKSIILRKLPQNLSVFEHFFCSKSNRRGFLCSQCTKDYGISIYTYYGLPCGPCYSYGIPLYLLLEIGFSTVFFLVLVMFNFSANSGKWITVILYFEVFAHLLSNSPNIYTMFAWSGKWVPVLLHTLYSVWNMDFFRLVIPPFCVNKDLSVLGAISTGYISAFCPLMLVLFTSLAVHLHMYNFKVVVYPWNILNWITLGLFRRKLARINLIHTFATFFLLSHLKLIYVSVTLLARYEILRIHSKGGSFSNLHQTSIDPSVQYFSPDHRVYAVCALLVLLLFGMLLPLALIVYPTRCGTLLGSKVCTGKLRNTAKTFIEAMNGSYKDGSNGTKDYRAVPGFMLLLRFAIALVTVVEPPYSAEQKYNGIVILFFVLAAFSGLCKPFKREKHNMNDVLILSLTAVQCTQLFVVLSLYEVERSIFHCIVALPFLPGLVVVGYLLKDLTCAKV